MGFPMIMDLAITILILLMFVNAIFDFFKHQTPSKNKVFLTILFIITAITFSYIFFFDYQFSTYLLIGIAFLFILSNLLPKSKQINK